MGSWQAIEPGFQLLSRACVLTRVYASLGSLWFPVGGRGWSFNFPCIVWLLQMEISLSKSLAMLELLWQYWSRIPRKMSLKSSFYIQLAISYSSSCARKALAAWPLLTIPSTTHWGLFCFCLTVLTACHRGSDRELLVRAAFLSPSAWVGNRGGLCSTFLWGTLKRVIEFFKSNLGPPVTNHYLVFPLSISLFFKLMAHTIHWPPLA